MEAPDLGGVVPVLIIFGIIIAVAVFGCWGLIDYLWIDDSIRVSEPLIPKLELTVKDNIIDTVYVYQLP